MNKDEILERFLKSTNTEIEGKLKVYKRSTSMIDIKPWKKKKEKVPAVTEGEEDYDEDVTRSKSIDVIMRQEEGEENRKVTDIEKKNTKKMFMTKYQDFPEEEMEEDSKAAKLAASQKAPFKPKKVEKKDKIIDIEEQKLRDEKKRQSD